MVDAYTTSTVPSIPQPLAMPSPSLKNKFSIRSLRAKFKSTPSTLEESAHVVDWEKLHPKRSISEPFNPWDLSPSDPSTPASMGNWSPSLSPSTTSRASFPEKGLPTPSPPQPVPVVKPESYESTEDFDIPRRHLPEFAESNVVQATNELAVMKLTVPEVENGVKDGDTDYGIVSTKEDEPRSLLQPVHHPHFVDVAVTLHQMKSGMNDLPVEIPGLLNILDDIAKIHPSISVVILAFKAAYNMEKTRRENDKRILLLYVAMKDMLAALVQLRDVRDSAHVCPDGQLMQPRLQMISERAAQDIKDCANVCDTYLKKTLIVKVLRSQVWETRLTGFLRVFAQRRQDYEFALSIHTAVAVDTVGSAVEDVNQKVTELTAMVIEVFRKEWTPWGEFQLARKVEEKGGVKFVENSDTMLSELANWDAGAGAGQKETNGAGHAARLQGRTVKSSSLTLQDLKDELFEDWESAVQKNMETFEGKFALHQRQLQEELARFIREENNRLIDEVNKGPHDKIKNEELKAIWKEMDWKLNVKARLFVMTLRDHYKDKAESAAMSPFVQSPRSSQRSDDWAFEFINAKYLQPIMEAFDDDGSGYVTYQEVNEFVESRPLSLNWSLPHWVAYWAIGWQIISSRYRDRIVGLFEQMFAMRCELRPENRYWADYYLSNVWPVAFELTQSLRPANVAEHIEDKFQTYADFEEERIRKNLEDIRFDIDALDTVYVVAGPGRIEKYCFPLIYLLLKRDIEVFRIARTKVLHKEELLDSADSVLWVLKAVNYRYLDLSVLFKQNHLNVDSQMKITACGLFDYMHDSSSLWIWRNLQAIDENGSSDSSIEPNVCEWDRILNYPLQDGHSFKCSLYDTPLKQEVQADAHARMPVRAILGEWNGFVYNEDQYPAQLMTSFQAHAVPSDPLGFRASGIHDGVSFELSGRCHQGGDRTIKLTFIIRYSREYRPQYFTGYLDRSGSIVGTEGWEADESSHSNQFILKRLPARLLCYRPSPMKFEKNKARALWKYAIDVVLHEVRRHYWTWSYFSERRETRLRYIELSIRFSAYGHLPNERELAEWLIYKQSVLAVDASFYRILRDERLKIIPSHDCYCHGCGGKIGGSRLICLDCLSAEPEARTVDFCDNPECHQIVHAPNGKSDQSAKHHNPGHDVFKVRTVLHLRDVPRMSAMAGNALNVCREFFQNATPVIDTGLLATVHDNDAIRDTLASYFDEPAVQPTLSSSLTNIQCRICQHAVQQPCWFCVDCFALEEEVYICDDCETKTLLQCTHCQKPYKQPSWYYGSHPSDNFMCNTCNWNRTEAPDVVRSKQHTYLHALVRCTSKAENEDDQGPPSTDQRIMALERTVGALDGKMGRLEEALSRIERLLVTNLSTNSTQGEHSAALCARCRTFIPPEVV